MTKNLFKLLLMSMILVLALSGCNMIAVDQATDDATIVAEYADGVITKGEAIAEYNDIVAMYEAEGYGDALKDAETVKGIKQDVLEYMVHDRILEAKTKEMGLDAIPEDKRQELIASSAQEFLDIVDQYTMYLRTEDQTDEEARAATLSYLRTNMGVDEQTYVNYALADYKQEQVFNAVTEGVELAEEDIAAAYDEAVETDKTNFTETPASFGTAKTNGDDTYWAPEGYRTVKHILLPTPQDLADKRDELDVELGDVEIAIEDLTNPEADEDSALPDESEGDADIPLDDEGVVQSAAVTPEEGGVPGTDAETADAETADDAGIDAAVDAAATDLGLAVEADDGLEVSVQPVDAADEFDDEFDDEEDEEDGPDYSAMSLDELNALKADLEAQIAALDQQILAALTPKYEEIKAKLDAGESFDSLIETYGEDPGMQSEPTKTTGYYVSADSDNWDQAFKDGAMALEKVGDVSGPVMGSYGMHIIRYEADVPSGPVDYESVKETLREHALEDKKQAVYEETVQGWYDAANISLHPEKL